MLITSKLRVKPNIVTRIYRTLGGKGKLNVSIGQEVAPSDIIGVYEASSGFRILNLVTLLSVPPNQVQKFLKKKLGERIYKGELLAYKEGGIFGGKKIVTSPSDSTIDFINLQTGEVRMSILPKTIELPSGVFGIIESIDHPRSRVVIKSLVSKVYGVFGTGRPRDGILHIIGKRDDLILNPLILPNLSDQIILGGSIIYKEGISEAISAGVSGIITGGINAADYKSMAGGRISFPKKLDTDIGISLLTTEGFGPIPIGWDIYQLLLNYDGKFVIIDGNAATLSLPSFEQKSLLTIKNTQLPNVLDVAEEKFEGHVVELKIGMRVRVVGTSFIGEEGSVLAIDKSESLLPSKVKATIVTLETKRRKLQVPINNIEAF